LPLAAPASACGECLRDPPPFDAAVCAVDYSFPWDGLVQAYKFHDRVDLAATLAGLLATAVRDTVRSAVDDAAGSSPQLVLPVPLSPQRLQQRGHQQAWGLARALARELGLPAQAEVLQRTIDTPQQSGLDRAARQRNLRAAFWVPPEARPRVQGRHLALVDDVMTTGATLREAAATLQRAGAASVHVWVFARTP
jgi:ComF family protein